MKADEDEDGGKDEPIDKGVYRGEAVEGLEEKGADKENGARSEKPEPSNEGSMHIETPE